MTFGPAFTFPGTTSNESESTSPDHRVDEGEPEPRRSRFHLGALRKKRRVGEEDEGPGDPESPDPADAGTSEPRTRRKFSLGALRKKKSKHRAETEPGSEPDAPGNNDEAPDSVETPLPRRRGRQQIIAGLRKKETRIGLAALLSFVILLAVLVRNKGKDQAGDKVAKAQTAAPSGKSNSKLAATPCHPVPIKRSRSSQP